MIPIYKEDYHEAEELAMYDDFNPYGLPMRPISFHRGIARSYPLKKRPSSRRGIARPYSRSRGQIKGKARAQILLPRDKVIPLRKPRQRPLEELPLIKVLPADKNTLADKKKELPIQRVPARRVTKDKIKALKEEVAQKEAESKAPKQKKISKKKILIVALVITATTAVGYVLWKRQHKNTL
ncbi:hypothetical protein ACFO3O_22120 [Dokdonia ponticola]|uniref:Uncharacterized protein n=1 Tax=Dokdonia ponticola TaxID=2041041 RepID=A0ABV9I2H8_9FLAO